jgi:hypothetical protein
MRNRVNGGLRRLLAVAIGGLAIVGLALGVASPAAAVGTQIVFDDPSTSAAFGSDWVVPITVSAPDYGPLSGPSGTVSVFIEGIAGAFAEGMPIYAGGAAFVAQPDAQPLLAAGDYRLTAVFTPAPDSGLTTSQTSTPFVLTIAPLALEARAAVDEVVGDEGAPYLHLWLSGEYVDALGAPAGSWDVAIASDSADPRTMTLDQPAGSVDPLEVSLADDVRPGRSIEVTATFIPDAGVAGGITLTDAEPVSYYAPSSSPGEVLTSAVLLPWWLVVVLALLLAGLVAGLVIVILKSRTPSEAAPEDEPIASVPGEDPPA